MTKPNGEQFSQLIDWELRRIDALLRSEMFASTTAKAQQRANEKNSSALLMPGNETARVTVSRRDEKVATNLAGFYAPECALTHWGGNSARPSL